jgi:hypothetical protein
MYVFEGHATKAGYRPIDKDEWVELIANAEVISDVNMIHRRTRLLYLDSRWYAWRTIGEEHSCWELTSPERLLPLEDYQNLRWLFQDIERYRAGD